MEYDRTVEGESIDQILGKWKVIYFVSYLSTFRINKHFTLSTLSPLYLCLFRYWTLKKEILVAIDQAISTLI